MPHDLQPLLVLAERMMVVIRLVTGRPKGLAKVKGLGKGLAKVKGLGKGLAKVKGLGKGRKVNIIY